MNVTTLTGFGYITDQNGNIIGKYSQIGAGILTIPEGYAYTEVANQAALDAITLWVSPSQQAINLLTQIKANRDAYIDALIAGDTATQTSIAATQATLLPQAITAGVNLPASTVATTNAAAVAKTATPAAPA